MAKSSADFAESRCEQVAALPWRVELDGKLRVLLVTSRTNGKWMLPKGWPMRGKSDPQSALIEAQEEAGIEGEVSRLPIGSYRYTKFFDDGSTTPSQAMIYPVRVTAVNATWDEMNDRERRWVRPRKAARLVFEPDLSRFLIDLADERIALFLNSA
ncbi:NUDIX hydrolase [Devosia riboflavina]